MSRWRCWSLKQVNKELVNNIEIYLTQREGKSVANEKFIRTLKNKIYKNMAPKSKKLYIIKLDNIVNK